MPSPRKPNYKKGGNAGVEGTLYQINLLTIFLLNGLKRDEEWYLSTENDEAGKFDDLVFESPEGDIFLQAKHKKNTKKKISYEDLLSTNSKNDDFSLPKYFFSYMEIRETFDIESVIISTNNDLKIDVELKKHIEKDNLAIDDLLYYEGNKSSVYTFNESIIDALKPSIFLYYDDNLQRKNINRDVVTDDNIIEFLNCLQFLANYPNRGNLDSAVEKIISECEYAKNLDSKMVYNFIYKKMQDWFKQEKGMYLTKEHAKALFCEIRTNEYCGKLEKVDIYFENNVLPVADPNKRVWNVVPQENYIVNVLKLYRTLQSRNEKEFLLITPDFGDETKEMMVEAFRLPTYVYLIIICEDSDGSITEETCEKIRDILDTCKYKKCVLVCEEDNKTVEYFKESSFYELVEEEIEFDDVKKESREEIVKKNVVSFQGEDTSLVELLGHSNTEDLKEYVDPEMLVTFVRGEKVKVGSEVDELSADVKNYYIRRTFNPREENIPEEEICRLDRSKEKVILISDSPGMGKSTVLTYVAGVLKKYHPNLWVIKIDINNYTNVLLECRENDVQTVTVPQLLEAYDETRIRSDFEKKLFMLPAKVLLLIDGVDEISPDYKEIVLELINNCEKESNFAKIYVTTRPHLCDELERALRVKALSLSVFSREHQSEFLKKYWRNHLRLKKSVQMKRCEAYAERLVRGMSDWIKERESNMLAQIPLQTRMIAEVFQEKGPANSELGVWEGCKEFATGKGTIPELPKKINLVKLYRLFMLKKRHIFLRDKSKLAGNVISTGAVEKAYTECLLYHRLLALEVVLRKNEASSMNSYRELLEKRPEERNVVKLGIVQKVSEGYQFVHRTFAEFHVAECLVLELKRERQNQQFLNFFVDIVLTLMEFNVIRSFLNGFLGDESGSIPEETSVALASLDYTERLYNGDSTFLHTLIEEGSVHLFRFVFHCMGAVEKSIDIDKIRESFGLTLLHYAAKHLPEVVGMILDGGADVDAEDYDGNTPLHNAVTRDRLDVARFLLDRGADVNARGSHMKSALFGAIEECSLQMVELLLERGADLELADEDDCTPLHEACRTWNMAIIQILLKNGADMNSKSDDGSTPLHIACQWSDEAMEVLLRYGADPNVQNSKSVAPIHVCARWGHIDLFNLLTEAGGDINMRDGEGGLPLHWAAVPRQRDVLRHLLERCGVDVGDGCGNTALHLASANGHLDVVQFLVESGADVKCKNGSGDTPLHESARNNHASVVRYLVQMGAEVNALNNHGRTPLHSYSFNLDIAKFLVGNGLDVNIVDKAFGKAVLHYVLSMNKSNEYVEYLIENGADVNIKDGDGNAPIHYAVKKKDLGLVEYLISKGATPDTRNNKGRTLLHEAAKFGDADMLVFLMGAGVGVDMRDGKGQTALHVACSQQDSLYMVELLVDGGADVNVRDEEGCTPLSCLSRVDGSSDVLALLIRNGADVNVADKKGKTPLSLVIFREHTNDLRLLIESGAEVNVHDTAGSTTLTQAARTGDLQVVKILVENGADVNMPNEDGQTALHVASRWKYLTMLAYLLDHDAFVDAKDKEGCTALHVARDPETVTCLVSRGANVNSKDEKGLTPLHAAAARPCLYEYEYAQLLVIVRFLVEKGGDINVGDSEGRTALHHAASSGRVDKTKALVEMGADTGLRDSDGLTALDCARRDGRMDVATFLAAYHPTDVIKH